MLFAICGRFRPNVEDERIKVHTEFNEHLMQRSVRVRFGGPLFDADGRRSGVLLLVEANDRQEAERFLNESPYCKSELYDRFYIDELRSEVGGLK